MGKNDFIYALHYVNVKIFPVAVIYGKAVLWRILKFPVGITIFVSDSEFFL